MAKMPAFLKEGSPKEMARDKKMMPKGASAKGYEKSAMDMKVDKGMKPGKSKNPFAKKK